MAFDVIVAGAGPTGSMLTGLLARRGLRVLLADKAGFPRRKPCGEGLLPPGARVLERLGLSERLGRSRARLRGLAYRCGAELARCAFPGGPALGVPRLALDLELARWAAEGGARLEEGATVAAPLVEDGRVRGVLARSRGGASARWEARLTVAADGLHSPLRLALGSRVRWPSRKRWGLVGAFDRVDGAG